MGKPAARIGDMHVCAIVPHVGGPVLGVGVPNVLIGGMPAAVMGDLCTCISPVPDVIAMGSTGVFIGGRPAARMGDLTLHGGSITIGCPTVLIGEIMPGGTGGSAAQAAAPKKEGGGWLDILQTGLDIVGLIPGLGEIADGANALIYLARGDYANAALSAAAMIPIGGQAATAAKLGMKAADAAKTVVKNADEVAAVTKAVVKNADEAADATKATSKATKTAKVKTAKGKKTKPKKTKTKNKNKNTKENKNKTPKETEGKTNREKSTCLRDPINVATGEVVGIWTDFELPGIIPFKWERMYYSQMEYHGNFGHRWQGSYEQYLEIYPDDIYYCTGAGHVAFPAVKDGKSHYNRQEKMTLKRINGTYTVYDHKERLTYHFRHYAAENKKLITSISKAGGHAIHFKYDNTRLLQIIDSAGRTLDIETDYLQRVTGIIHQETTQKTRLMTYEYDDNGDLVKTTNALGKSDRMYYMNHLMQTRTNRNNVTFNWRYDGIDALAKCTKTWGDANKLRGDFTYLTDNKTICTDSLGHQTTYVHHKGIVWEEISEEGHIRKKQYNQYTELVKETDELGRSIQYKYDNRGNEIAVIYPDSTTVEMEYANDRLTALTNQNGATWTWEYNKNNELKYRVTPDGAVTHFEYQQGLLKKVTDAKGQSIQLEHDAQYNLIETTYFNNQKNTWEYDSLGNCIKTTDVRGNINQYDYDLLGRMTQIHQADGNITKLKYDAHDGVLRATDSQRDVKFEYTELGSLKSRTEKGRTIQFSYNTDEQLTFIRNEKNNVYRFRRNAKGQVVEEIGFDGITRKYLRDAAGQVNTIIRPNDKVINYKYDDNGQMYKVEHSDGSEEFYGYDKAGNLIEAVNEDATITLKRDSLGRVVEETQNGYTVNSEFDLNGRTQITSSLGASIQITRDEQHGHINTVKASHDAQSIWETQIKRDAHGLEIERLLPGAVRSTLERDNTGKIIEHNVGKTEQVLRQKRYTWDINNRLKNIFDGITEGQIDFNYDSFDNLIGASYPDGQELFKTSDEVGNLFKTKDQSDRIYDTGSRLMRSPEWKYQYDDEGNLIRKTNRKTKESWQYTWNVKGMLKEVIHPDNQKVSFKYDALGRRIQKTFEGKSTQWVWNADVPLHEWTQAKGKEAYTINNDGEINATIPENLTTWVFEEGSFVPMAKIKGTETYSIVTDYLGTPAEMYDSEGNRVWACELDIYGKVRILEGKTEDCPFRYQGQYEDVETGLYYNRFRYYSADEGVYISQDPVKFESGEPNFYAYVNDTNIYIDIFGLSKGSGTLGRNMVRAGMTHNLNPFTRGDFQAHHVIPHEVWVSNQSFFNNIGLGGAKDKATNGVFLPKNATVAQQGNFNYYHRGSHDTINANMNKKVKRVKRQFNNRQITSAQARQKIARIQNAERRRLSSRTGKTPKRCS